MKTKKYIFFTFVFAFALFVVFATGSTLKAQTILNPTEAARLVPSSFYFAGQSAPTQMRNSAAARIGDERYVIVGMVDTSGYSTEISGKYEGFLITDSPVKVGDKMLGTGAYGFGFATNGKIRIFDLSSKEIFSADTQNDAQMKRPRPLMMTMDGKGVRFYRGRNFVLITPN